MSAGVDMNGIRRLTRIALPDDDGYLYRLGIALYGFASLSSFMAEVASHLDPAVNRTELQAKTGGAILVAFRNCVEVAKIGNPAIGNAGAAAAEMFAVLNGERSDIVHAYPITNRAGEQILHRRLDAKGKYFEVTNEFLDSFISRLHDVSSKLYEVRSIARPDLDR